MMSPKDQYRRAVDALNNITDADIEEAEMRSAMIHRLTSTGQETSKTIDKGEE